MFTGCAKESINTIKLLFTHNCMQSSPAPLSLSLILTLSLYTVIYVSC